MLPPALNLPQWLTKNAHLLQPPVSNHCIHHPSSPLTPGYTVMVVGGPNARTDYHVNPTPEFFYQHTGSMLLRTVTNHTATSASEQPIFQDIPIHEGSLYLLPANTPHCPVRFEGTVGVVVEMPRPEGAADVLRWYCRGGEDGNEGCGSVVWEKRFVCTDLGSQVKEVVEEFGGDEGLRMCKGCGKMAGVRWGDGEVRRPARFPEES
ncbi:3-hydroxyanthranilate 3,4-dioxygenase [Helicocarpus griseus UAMH5409]|uniref:3-hydroxyanthranilate 3,4-dioxygenase n=1 Tax=Helicocarpus griseus UAMH5409 TaxID=1447875 RepID=A0A2B7WQW4_9EURO|nr:3-hydroxyanthranilate 3,4-dioxygenase [Helicocarpus griseus UAMH5409]